MKYLETTKQYFHHLIIKNLLIFGHSLNKTDFKKVFLNAIFWFMPLQLINFEQGVENTYPRILHTVSFNDAAAPFDAK